MTERQASMRAILMANFGRPRVLKDARCPMPPIAADEALVKIHAASVGADDMAYRSGALILRKPLPHILGSDLAGEIVALGDDCADFQVGDRVAACFHELGSEINGGYAEYCALPVDKLVKLPDNLDFVSAAAAGASFADAYTALVNRCQLGADESVVVFDAASDRGIAAAQIARHVGAQVIAISPSDYAAQLHAIGADIVLDSAGSDLVRQVKVATEERGATLCLHCAVCEDLAQSMDMLSPNGRLVLACAARRDQIRLNISDLYHRNLSLIGARESIATADYATILERMAAGTYQPVIDEIMPLRLARAAHAKLERKPGFGKIALVPDAILEAAKKPANWIPID